MSNLASPKVVKPKKGTTTPKTDATNLHPPYLHMVKEAIEELKEHKGSSKVAIFRYILQHYEVGDNEKMVNARVNVVLRRAVLRGDLKQVKGHGATGSFRLPAKKKPMLNENRQLQGGSDTEPRKKKKAGEAESAAAIKSAKTGAKPKVAAEKKPKVRTAAKSSASKSAAESEKTSGKLVSKAKTPPAKTQKAPPTKKPKLTPAQKFEAASKIMIPKRAPTKKPKAPPPKKPKTPPAKKPEASSAKKQKSPPAKKAKTPPANKTSPKKKAAKK